MPPDVSWFLLLALLPIAISELSPRYSCRSHFLAGHRTTGVYPVGFDAVSRLVCEMPSVYEGADTIVTTVVGTALETPTAVTRRSSSNFQAVDLFWLKEIVRTSIECRQTITVHWPSAPVDSVPSGLTLVSLLNVSTHIAARDGPQTFELTGSAAGVRHLLPDAEGSSRPPTVAASALRCRHPIVDKKECLTTGGIEIEASAAPWKYEFSFRTDRSDQAILSFLNGDRETTHVRLENDFFLRVDGGNPVSVGQLSDAEWHTATVKVESDGVTLVVDGITLDIATSVIKESRLTNIQIKVDGEVMLQEPCKANRLGGFHERRPSSSALCSGCGCGILPQHFDGLSSSVCSDEDEDDTGFQLLRDPDRLSFLHIPDSFKVDTNDDLDIRVAMSFKSDSDAGLLLFGYWHGMPGKGRWQVHYAGATASSLICQTYDGEEVCKACGITNNREFGLDDWHRVVFFGSGDSYTFSIDRQSCNLAMITAKNNISTAEVYAIPAVTQGVGLFVGGTYYEKKKSGLYRSDFTQRYFENTREKMTSLRGCVKDVFVHGKEVDLARTYRSQMESVLLDSEDMNSFAMQVGCASCDPSCPDNVRCRSPAPVKASLAKCDCSDVQLIETSDGVCAPRNNQPVPLSTSFVSESPVVLPLETTKSLLARLWLKLKLPKEPKEEVVIADFNSHRETMFRVIVSPEGTLSVQAHPHAGTGFATTASHPVSLNDDRVHLISITRRTPVGTRHTARKYELNIDGEKFELPDTGKSLLNNVTFVIANGLDEEDSVIVHDIGIGYDLDEHVFLWHPSNTIHQVDLHSQLHSHLYREPDFKKTGTLDPYLWEGEASPRGEIVDYSPDIFEPELLLSSRWIFYSVILAMLLLLLLLACLCCYCCLARGRTRSNASDRETMMRDSPDYAPVKLRRGSSNFSFHDDNSIGTDDTDLNAYRDIPSHRVKIYRESMVSILVPSIDIPCEAAIVKRLSVEVPTSPPPGSPAPLVSVTEEEH